ncbi:hypothetical protein KCP71_20850 [Salmonella enterica subsp. enterica]|nr:hypothetical protein KCP71_20850 [Salmonella enterica subsp. enterica]
MVAASSVTVSTTHRELSPIISQDAPGCKSPISFASHLSCQTLWQQEPPVLLSGIRSLQLIQPS